LDRIMGLDAPGTPGWTLNETTDLLLKKEFDECRTTQTPHRLFSKNSLDHLVPFKHPDMDKWRDSLRHGLIKRYKGTNIILTGGVDDIWQNTNTKELVVVDYKSQAGINVFVVEYKSQADLLVYKVDYKSQANGNEGLWFFVDYKSQADFKIFFVDYKSQADLKIYFVDYKSQAGWTSNEKKHLLY